jgi:hypothetical protein
LEAKGGDMESGEGSPGKDELDNLFGPVRLKIDALLGIAASLEPGMRQKLDSLLRAIDSTPASAMSDSERTALLTKAKATVDLAASRLSREAYVAYMQRQVELVGDEPPMVRLADLESTRQRRKVAPEPGIWISGPGGFSL